MSSKVGKIETDLEDRTLILMMGLPYSGKTTEAIRLSDMLACPIVCPDAIRVALHGQRFVPEAEGWVWELARTMVRALFMAGHEYVIVDATHTKRKHRDAWRHDGPSWKVHVRPVRTDSEVCADRALAAGDQDMIPIIDRMADAFEPLDDEEEYGNR